jgi:hypothetical protein
MDALNEEFATVDLILRSDSETRAVDAFALSLIKAERQIRKIFTHLVFQSPAFDKRDVQALRDTLVDRRVYFANFISGINVLYENSVEQLIGPEYPHLKNRMDEATLHRNKIFHGQLTALGLRREDLESLSNDIRAWCKALGRGSSAEIGYDGFGRNSFQKSQTPNLIARCRVQISSQTEYREFIRKNMER